MKKAGGRLDITGAISYRGHLEPLDHVEYKSHSASKADKEIKALKHENQKLKADLAEIRSLYKQLVTENVHEKFDERRVTVLKSQIIQLERQLLLLSEALSSRSEVLLEVENNLQWLADKCRSWICKDVRSAQIPVDRSELTLMVETTESARIKLYKQLENCTTQNLARPLRFYSDFLKQPKQDDSSVTLLDVASGNLDHLNLRHVTQLESKLSSLYRELIHLHAAMEDETGNESAYLWTSCHVTQAARERLMTQVLKSCAQMKECASDLLELSILFPSAPWPPLKKCALRDITAEQVLQSVPKSRSQELQRVIHALVKAYNYKVYMLNTKNQSLREEVKYHQKVYNLQLKYTESLFQAIREAYSGFEETSNEVVVKPLKEILEAYVELSQSASEVSLKRFVKTFKDHVPQMSDIVETLSVKEGEESDGSKVLSQYGEEFFHALEKLMRDHQQKRDREAGKMEDLRSEQERLDQELRKILEEQESKLPQKHVTSSVHEQDTMSSDNEHSVMVSSVPVNNDMISDVSRSFPDNNHIKTPEFMQHDKFVPEFLEKKKKTCESDQISNNSGDSGRKFEKHSHKIWASQLRGQNDSEHNMKMKQLHKQEWVNVFDDSVQSEGQSDPRLLTENLEREMSDAELLAHHSNVSDPLPQRSSDVQPFTNLVEKPLKQKVKKKPSYTPNTFVPNRTLQLRKSGSMSRLAVSDDNDSLDFVKDLSEESCQTAKETGRKSAKAQKHLKPKPAFR